MISHKSLPQDLPYFPMFFLQICLVSSVPQLMASESGSLAPWEVKHFGSGQFKAIDIAPQLLDNESERHWMPNQEMQLLAPND